MGQTDSSKNLQREINNMFNEKELKVNTLRSLGEELNRKTMRLTDLRAKQERRKLDEQQLKEQQTQLAKLQRELKVGLVPVGVLTQFRNLTSQHRRQWLLGGRRTRRLSVIAPSASRPRMMPVCRSAYTSRVCTSSSPSIGCASRT